MQFWYYLRANVQMLLKQLPLLMVSLVVVPLVLAGFLTYSSQGLIEPKPAKLTSTLAIDNQDTGLPAQVVEQSLQQLAQNNVFEISSKIDKADFTVVIPRGFSDAVQQSQQTTPLQLQGHSTTSNRASLVFEVILKNITSQLLEQADIYQLALQVVENDEQQAQQLASQVLQNTQVILEKVDYQNEIYHSPQMLTAAQYFSTAGTILLWQSLITAVLAATSRKELIGLQKRNQLLPLTTRQRETYGLLVNFLEFSFFVGCYVLVWRFIDPLTFTGNPWILGGILSVYLFFYLTVSGLVSIFMTEKLFGGVTGMLSVLFIFFSGLIPIDRISEQFTFVTQNPMRKIFIEPLITNMQGGDMRPYYGLFVTLLVISLFCYELQMRILKSREEY